MLYAIVAAIVVTLLVGSAAAMVWDPRRRDDSLDEFERDLIESEAMAQDYARARREWPRKEMI
ncbi:hypothetical protein AB0H00_24265 [Nocardia sp. NPDC023852]|uniref:hypothetical protein n=1 Tax=Nocardia sp. NPDC023852 TaxID=3154697 RepID=UPI0033FEC7F8